MKQTCGGWNWKLGSDFVKKEILSDFSLTREIDAYKNYAMWQNFNSWMIKFTFKHLRWGLIRKFIDSIDTLSFWVYYVKKSEHLIRI